MTLIEIFSILLIHWLCDFVLQSDWQAQNKSKNNVALIMHTLTYSICWLPFMAFLLPSISVLTFILITFVCHTITDYFTSRLNSKLWAEGKVHYFFVSIGFDQILHYVQLFLTYQLLK